MATMNRPAANAPDWYQAVTDNWTSIENDLLDNSAFTAKGDLLAAMGPSAPARLGVGSDEQLLSADSTQSAGVRWAGSIGIPDAAYSQDLLFDKRFFSKAGLLPGTLYYETPPDQAPTITWDNTGVTSTVTGPSRRWTGVAATQLLGWDLGGLKQRILLIFSGYQNCGGDRLIFMATTKPTSGDETGNGYAGGINSTAGASILYRITSGGYTRLALSSTILNYYNVPHSAAMLFDNGNIRYFYRFGNRQWLEGTYYNDGTYTTLRYCGVRMWSGGSLVLGPVGIYYDT